MAEEYWTHCMYCGEMICGVEILPKYPDVVVLSAHSACHAREARTCPDCNTPLTPPATFNIGSHGQCLSRGAGCTTTKTSTPLPESCKEPYGP